MSMKVAATAAFIEIVDFSEKMIENSTAIAQLNDQFRHGDGSLGTYVLTPGVKKLPSDKILELHQLVQNFSSFTEDNDPHREHDFGAIVMDDKKYFWKISYYDPTFTYASENPSDIKVTRRVLTLMKSSEY